MSQSVKDPARGGGTLVRAVLMASLAVAGPTLVPGQSVPSGYQISVFAQPAELQGRHMAGLVVDPTTGDVYVASTPTIPGLLAYCNDWTLHRVTPAGVVTQISNQFGPTFPAPQLEVVEMEWGPDNAIYACSEGPQEVLRIDPQTGTTTVYNSAHMAGGGRHGIQFDAQGNLIFTSLHHIANTFYLIPPGLSTLGIPLGSFTASQPPTERCVKFDIDANGDYILFPEFDGFVSRITTAGHVPGQNFPITHLTTSQFPLCAPSGFDLPFGGSIGALWEGNAYVSTANVGYGAGRILRADLVTGDVTVFVEGIGTGIVTTNACFDQQGVTDITVGPRSDLCSGESLYFLDNFNQRIYEVRTTCVLNDNCGGAFALAEGVTNGDNSDATTAAGVPALCGTGSRDVWYAYTNTSCDRQVTLSLCPEDGGSAAFDAMLAVFSGGCGTLTPVACSTSDCGTSPRVTFAADAGATYYVAVFAEGAGPGGAFALAASSLATAAVESFGTGSPPTIVLASTNPVIGQLLAMSVLGAAPGDVIALAAGERIDPPYVLLPGGAEFMLAFETAFAAVLFAADASGQWIWGPHIPDVPLLECAMGHFQAVILPSIVGGDWKASNGLTLTFGY